MTRDDPLEALLGPDGSQPGPRIAHASSGQIATALTTAERAGPAQLRYYLSAGSGAAVRPLWAFSIREDSSETDGPLPMVQAILHCREERQAAIEHELGMLGSWLAGPAHLPKVLVAEIFGHASRDQVGFLRACGQRLSGRSDQLRIVVLRHAGHPEALAQPHVVDPQREEILLALQLAGGYASTADLDRWAQERRWLPADLEAVTSPRTGSHGQLRTYSSTREWAQARTLRSRAAPEILRALATMVTGTDAVPLISTAALGTDPARALTALSRAACAVAADSPLTLLQHSRAVLRASWFHGWSPVNRSTAYALYLAAFVNAGGRRLSPAAGDRVLAIAERTGVDAQVRSLLGYHLGQLMAKAGDPQRWDASMRYLEYARDCVRATTPAAQASRVAASYNGEALARHRAGDRDGAVRAELAGLAALAAPEVPVTTALVEQQVLLLTNLAQVYGRSESTEAEAVRCSQRAFGLALDADSLMAMTYVVPGLVRRLLARGWQLEAERVTGHLLGRYDREATPRRAAEQAVVEVCCRLAAARLTADPMTAAAWYAEAALRMSRAAPQALDAIVRNLRAHDATRTAATLERLDAELAVHQSTQHQLSPLATLLDRR